MITGLVQGFMTLMNEVQSNVPGNPLSEGTVTNNGWLPKHQSLYGLICDSVSDVLANLITTAVLLRNKRNSQSLVTSQRPQYARWSWIS